MMRSHELLSNLLFAYACQHNVSQNSLFRVNSNFYNNSRVKIGPYGLAVRCNQCE